jgi:2,3-bisphosphoglycerate-independent phosphoglycerate mutase
MNLVTLNRVSDAEIIMVSHSSGDISTQEAVQIVKTLTGEMKIPGITIYPALTIPPHDVLGQNMAHYLNPSPGNPIPDLIRGSWEILNVHPVNAKRRELGLTEANSIWPWGQGKAPKIPSFVDKYGLRGGVIAAVDLIKGIGIYAGLTPIYVEGATGYLDTNYKGKAQAALEGLQTLDFVFLHVEAPDEAGHSGNYKEKIRAIENFDEKVVGTVLRGLKGYEAYRVIVVSDHFTPVSKRTHTNEPTPFAWGSKREIESLTQRRPFTEEAARRTGLVFDEGERLMAAFLAQS